MTSIFSGTYIPSASSSTAFPEPWDEGFEGDIPFRAECFKVSYYLFEVWLWVSVLVPICCRRKLLWWWTNKALIYEGSRMLLKVISLLFSKRPVVLVLLYFAFTLQSPFFIRPPWNLSHAALPGAHSYGAQGAFPSLIINIRGVVFSNSLVIL